MVNPYTQFLPDDQRNAMIGAMRSGPPAGTASTMPVGAPVKGPSDPSGDLYNPTTNPGGTQLPYVPAPDVITKDQLPPIAPAPRTDPSYVPSGWDATKWNDPNKHDLKYDLGHLLASVSNNGQISAADVQKIAPQIAAMGVKWDGGDGLTMPDGNQVDFIKGMKAGNGTGTLNWLDSTMQGGGAPSASIMPVTAPGGSIATPSLSGGNDTSFWQHLMESLKNAPRMALANGGQPVPDQMPNMSPEQTQMLFNLLNQPKDPNLMHAMSVAPSGASMASLLKG